MYQYTNPKMQEVAKLCEKGFWPICKNERGEYAIFSPVINGIDCLRKTDWVNSIKRAKEIIGATFHDNTHIQPTEIVDFYHPPTPKFEVGDKVRIMGDKENVIGKIKILHGFTATISFNGRLEEYPVYVLEPVIETKPIEMTVAEIEEKLGVKNLKIVK